ncbi:SMC-Scp complex subunit ScpB [Mobilicoccus caccae]|uniref:Segregation and condensation protein B n=1 Tax=Mobilicoccus caccae TaxID=1859295 RepID=A0ABQ6INY5_9MICO|nr:SMC-Scp complex subunit ScpB [Mobilicoccus caccae]GMA39642.1 segregation and condensation protein B [Mobilicoccus caccae]
MSTEPETDVETTVETEEIDLASMPGGARTAIEAVVMVVEEPVTEETIARTLEITPQEATAHLQSLAGEYDDQGRGFSLRRTGAGWRVYSRAEYAPVVERFVLEGQRAKLSQAALETLAVVAYRQPVSRARISAVRGVSVDGVVRTLTTRGLIEEVGTDAEHGAVLYGTTDYFLTRLGLGSLSELPALAPYLPEGHAVDEIAERGGI